MDPQTNPVDVRFSNISYRIPIPRKWHSYINPFANPPPPPTTILHNISGYVPAGKSLAILGPSGSGKTTLLNLLAARSQYPPHSGQILFAGAPRVPRTKRHIGYVMQDDVFFSKLTVRETLEFTANIRIPNLSPAHRKSRVDAVMRNLRLNKCRNTRIGDQQFDKGISGGERKRVNIANELLHDPTVLLADECTSGLDSSSAFTVINLLKQLCNDGRTVIATIHQPSSQMFSLFDRIMLLAAGQVAYYGTPQSVVSYFESIDFPFPVQAYNPADYMLELVIDDEVKASEEDDFSKDVQEQQERPSTQRAILEAWEARGPALLAAEDDRDRDRSRQSTRKSPSMPSGEVVLDISGEETSPSVTLSPLSDVSTDDSPYSEDIAADPFPPTSRAGRVLRASRKRAYDFTGQHDKLGEPDKYPTGWFQQVLVLGKRALRQKSGVLVQAVYIAQVVCVTVISALFWWQIEPREGTIEDRLGALSFFSVFWAFYSSFSALFAFPAEKRVLNKDRAGGSYRLSAYYFAKTMIETPADMLYPIFFSLVVYFALGLNSQFRAFALFTFTLILNVLAAQSIGLFISAVVMDVRQAQVVASVWILSSMLISGYYINPDNTPSFLMWFRSLSFIKYCYEALARIEMLPPQAFRCAEGDEVPTEYSEGLTAPCELRSEEVLRGAELDGSLSIAGNIGVLIAWIVAARILGYFALKLLHTSHKPKSSSWKRL